VKAEERQARRQDEVRHQMDKLFFIGCLAFLVWCVWFFWVKD